jgi:hypothetical protein
MSDVNRWEREEEMQERQKRYERSLILCLVFAFVLALSATRMREIVLFNDILPIFFENKPNDFLKLVLKN